MTGSFEADIHFDIDDYSPKFVTGALALSATTVELVALHHVVFELRTGTGIPSRISRDIPGRPCRLITSLTCWHGSPGAIRGSVVAARLRALVP